jgi:hypothetical protein
MQAKTEICIIFDQGLGDLFVVRTAGGVVDSVALGSIEYAVEHLVHRLISGRHTALGDLADFQGASDEHPLIRT